MRSRQPCETISSLYGLLNPGTSPIRLTQSVEQIALKKEAFHGLWNAVAELVSGQDCEAVSVWSEDDNSSIFIKPFLFLQRDYVW